eukprot:gene7990-9831_t
MTDISSDDIVRLLSFTLKQEEKKSKEILDDILSLPFDDRSLIISIRSLSLDQVEKLLDFIFDKHLKIYSREIQESQQQQNQISIKHLINWVSIIIDAHYQQLSSIKNFHDKYFSTINHLLEDLDHCFFTKSFYEQLQQNENTTKNNSNYSIQLFQF